MDVEDLRVELDDSNLVARCHGEGVSHVLFGKD